MSIRIARREFLKRALRDLGAMGVGATIAEAVVGKLLSQAFAQTPLPPNPSGYYVHMTMPGGPPRWLFDLPLTPQGQTSSNFVAGGFGTLLEKTTNGLRPFYAATKQMVGGKEIHLPPVWTMSTSGQRFTDLLPNTLFIRGMDMEINSHELSNGRQIAPIIGGYSLNGMVAERSNRPMPAVIESGSGAAKSFKSKSGLATSSLDYAEGGLINPISTLLTPFIDFRGQRVVHSQEAQALQDQALAQFELYANSRGIASAPLKKMYDNAISLVESDIFKLSERWPATIQRYRAIINEALHPKKDALPGLFDIKGATSKSGPFKYAIGADSYVQLGDLRDMITAETMAPRMAENFAIAEILLDPVTAAMTLSFGGLRGLESGQGVISIGHDQHAIGSVVSTLATTLFYRAFIAGLTEFVKDLKSRGLFERTVIHISSEFNRTPRAGGEGSDHGPMGSNATLISGMLAAGGVIGNIKTASYNSTYPGTFGVAAPYSLDGFNRPIQVNDVARTISAMLGTDDIVTSGRSLLAPTGAAWHIKKPESKNV